MSNLAGIYSFCHSDVHGVVVFAEGSFKQSQTNYVEVKDPGKIGGAMVGKRILLTHPVEMDNSADP